MAKLIASQGQEPRYRQIVTALRQQISDGALEIGSRLPSSRALAQDLGVSVRTIYRDMEVLAASGVPVEGTRGYGYTVQAAITLPPLNLTEAELEALHLALAVLGRDSTVYDGSWAEWGARPDVPVHAE